MSGGGEDLVSTTDKLADRQMKTACWKTADRQMKTACWKTFRPLEAEMR